MMEVYKLALMFLMKRLKQLCLHYLSAKLNHSNVLEALENAEHLKLNSIKELCISFIVKDSNFTQIVMSQEFETIDQPLMVEIIRKQQLPQEKKILKQFDLSIDLGNHLYF